MAVDEADQLMTADDVAAMLAVSVPTVRRMAEDGRLNPVRLGSGPMPPIRFTLADVRRLIAEGTTR